MESLHSVALTPHGPTEHVVVGILIVNTMDFEARGKFPSASTGGISLVWPVVGSQQWPPTIYRMPEK
jgi:hypothetical protein